MKFTIPVPSPNTLAQIGHFLAGYSVAMTVHTFPGLPAKIVFWGFVGWTNIKEWGIDLTLETPKQTFLDSLLDFNMYWAGYIAGTIVSYYATS